MKTMSKTKFNGFEKYVIQEALKLWMETAEDEVKEASASNKRLIYAPGYFTMVGEELSRKINSMTLKKDKL